MARNSVAASSPNPPPATLVPAPIAIPNVRISCVSTTSNPAPALAAAPAQAAPVGETGEMSPGPVGVHSSLLVLPIRADSPIEIPHPRTRVEVTSATASLTALPTAPGPQGGNSSHSQAPTESDVKDSAGPAEPPSQPVTLGMVPTSTAPPSQPVTLGVVPAATAHDMQAAISDPAPDNAGNNHGPSPADPAVNSTVDSSQAAGGNSDAAPGPGYGGPGDMPADASHTPLLAAHHRNKKSRMCHIM